MGGSTPKASQVSMKMWLGGGPTPERTMFFRWGGLKQTDPGI